MQALDRQLVLNSLDLIFLMDKKRIENIQAYREDLAEQVWLVLQLRKHTPPGVFEQLVIEQRVNRMDPDFSFYKTVYGDEQPAIEPLDKSLL